MLDCQRNRMKENRQVSKVFIFILEKLHCYKHFHPEFYGIDRCDTKNAESKLS